MNAVVLYRTDDARSMHRYYWMDVQSDLFGAWCLIREWRRIGSPGQKRSVAFPTSAEAAAALDKQRRSKERRGYGPLYQAGGFCCRPAEESK